MERSREFLGLRLCLNWKGSKGNQPTLEQLPFNCLSHLAREDKMETTGGFQGSRH